MSSELRLEDLLRVDNGSGYHLVAGVRGARAQPGDFHFFLMWVLADLFTLPPEVGDLDKP